MLVNRKYDKATILIIAAGLLAYASFQPKFRLRTALPREFIDESSSWPAEKRVSEEKVARAYWNCAVTQIQWKYGYGHRLPQDSTRICRFNGGVRPHRRRSSNPRSLLAQTPAGLVSAEYLGNG